MTPGGSWPRAVLDGNERKNKGARNMNGSSVRRYLEEVARQLEQGFDRVNLRKAAVSLAIPAAARASGCFREPEVYPMYGVPEYGAAFEEVACHDGEDEDYDGLTDCDDSDCQGVEVCLGCFDGLDNDGNGLADCADPTCATGEGCLNTCDDEADNDADGRTDCADPDCAGSAACP